MLTVVLLDLEGRTQELLPLLKTPSGTFTNVVIIDVTRIQVFFRNARELHSAQLSDLDPDLQAKFGYATNAAAAEPATNRDSFRIAVASGTSAATDGGLTNTNTSGVIPPGWHAKDFPVDGAGTLTLVFPDLWADSFQPPPANSPPYATLRLKRPLDDDLLVQLTTIPAGEKVLQLGAPEVMANIGARALTGAVEKNLDLKELDGTEAHGCYFTLTDRKLATVSEPKPGSFKYQTQGLVMLNGLGLSFTILYNFPATCDPVAALEMVRTAAFSPSVTPATPAIR